MVGLTCIARGRRKSHCRAASKFESRGSAVSCLCNKNMRLFSPMSLQKNRKVLGTFRLPLLVLGTRASPLDSSPIEPLQWMVTPLHRGVLNLSLTHFVIKLILTSKVEPPLKRLLNLRGNFLRTGGVQEQGASLLTVKRTSTHGERTHTCASSLRARPCLLHTTSDHLGFRGYFV